jgi:GTPase SAR1 family protein
MRFSGIRNRQSLIRWAEQLRAIAARRDNAFVAEAIESAINQLQSERFVITVLGKAKRGKSTLLNALLGRTDDVVAPIDKLPASSAISRFHWADREVASVSFRDGRSAPIGFREILQYVTEEANPENKKGVGLVEIGGQFPGLEKDLVLIDTPGAGSIHEHHDALLHQFLPQSDAVIFLVTARMPLDQDELELLKSVKAADIRKVFFAVNRVDEATAQDIDDAITHNRRLLEEAGVAVGELHRISAKRAYQGDLTGSGIPGLLAEIQRFLAANKARLLEERFVSRVCQYIEAVGQGLDVELANASRSVAEIDAELASLKQKRQQVDGERVVSTKEFQASWRRAIEEFARALPDARRDVTGQVARLIEEIPLSQVGKLAKKLPGQLTDAVEQRLQTAVNQLEDAIRNATAKLEADYPSLRVGEVGAISIKVRSGSALAAGAVGGAAAVATGVSLVGAGTAAAAAIAAANAAAAAATTIVTVPTIASTLLALLPETGFLAPLFAGTATVSAPAALTTTPLWVALAGPVGWTLAGVGVLAVPIAWRISKSKAKDSLDTAARDQVTEIFEQLERVRVPDLRKLGESIVEEFQVRLDRQIHDIETVLLRARDHRPDPAALSALQSLAAELRGLMTEAGSLSAASVTA